MPDSASPVAKVPPEPAEAQEQHGAAATLKLVAFVAVIQVLAILMTHVNAPAVQASGYQYAPAGTSSTGSVGNVLILVAFVFAATIAAVWLVRQRRAKVFLVAVFLGTALALFLLTLLGAIDWTSSFLDAYSSLYVSLAFATATVAVLALVVLRKVPSWFGLIITGLLSAEVGSYFASTIPILTAILLPLGFSLYDVYTVFRGPLKTLVTSLPEESFSAISSRVGDFSLGTGDTVFYAMVPALAYYQFTVASALATMVAVDVGVVATLFLLSRVKLLPGLPIPMFLGVAVLLVFYFL